MTQETGIAETLRRFDGFQANVDVKTRARLQRALDVIGRAIDIFGLEGVSFSFNGGKDSTVVLHLLRIVIAKRVLDNIEQQQLKTVAGTAANGDPTSTANGTTSREGVVASSDLEELVEVEMSKLPVMYFDSTDQFPEVRAFIEDCIQVFSLKCHVYKCSFVEGVQDMLENVHIKGVYMGVRGGDPHTEDLEHYSPSSPGWPAFMRVNPILRWTYDDVWQFLRQCGLGYCVLYDHGYTSLGNIYDTVQNSELWVSGDSDAGGHYLPAYELKDGRLERSGRQKRVHAPSK